MGGGGGEQGGDPVIVQRGAGGPQIKCLQMAMVPKRFAEGDGSPAADLGARYVGCEGPKLASRSHDRRQGLAAFISNLCVRDVEGEGFQPCARFRCDPGDRCAERAADVGAGATDLQLSQTRAESHSLRQAGAGHIAHARALNVQVKLAEGPEAPDAGSQSRNAGVAKRGALGPQGEPRQRGAGLDEAPPQHRDGAVVQTRRAVDAQLQGAEAPAELQRPRDGRSLHPCERQALRVQRPALKARIRHQGVGHSVEGFAADGRVAQRQCKLAERQALAQHAPKRLSGPAGDARPRGDETERHEPGVLRHRLGDGEGRLVAGRSTRHVEHKVFQRPASAERLRHCDAELVAHRRRAVDAQDEGAKRGGRGRTTLAAEEAAHGGGCFGAELRSRRLQGERLQCRGAGNRLH
mmetsp:Transcript_46489/g.133888  ORF Transcript_46489/g.133888 Transcript_46489/m.133888 type:complete len:408 (+) Transcript_46489:639-1862(+)